MIDSPSFHQRYEQGETPWETHRVDQGLVRYISQTGLSPCSALDIGCGTGNNGIWLAGQGFEVTGWDLVEQAITTAKSKAKDAGVTCNFSQVDLLELDTTDHCFDFIFDRGLFHCFKSTNQLEVIARVIAELLPTYGRWLSMIGNADETRTATGPPQLTATEITTILEPLFFIDSIEASFFDSAQKPPAKNWICQMRKR